MNRRIFFLVFLLYFAGELTGRNVYAQLPFWIEGGGGPVESVSVDRKYMLQHGFSDYGARITLWQLRTGKYITAFRGNFDYDPFYHRSVDQIMFTSDGKYVVPYSQISSFYPLNFGYPGSLSLNKGLYSLDVSKFNENYYFEYSQRRAIYYFKVLEMGNRLVIIDGDVNGFCILDPTPTQFKIDTFYSAQQPLSMSNDGKFYVSSGMSKGEIQIFYRDSNVLSRIKVDSLVGVSSSFFADSRYLVVSTGVYDTLASDKFCGFTVYTLTPDSAHKIYSRPFPCDNPNFAYRTIAGRMQIITCSDSTTFHFIDLETGSNVKDLHVDVGGPEKLYCIGTDTLLVSTNEYPYLYFINVSGRSLLQENWSHDKSGAPIYLSNNQIGSFGGGVFNRRGIDDLSRPQQMSIFDPKTHAELYPDAQPDSALSYILHNTGNERPVLRTETSVTDSCSLRGSIVRVFPHHNRFILHNGDSIVLFSYNAGKFLELDKIALLDKDAASLSIALSRDGQHLCIAEISDSLQSSSDTTYYTFRIFNVKTHQFEVQVSPDPPLHYLSGMAISANGEEIAVYTGSEGYRFKVSTGKSIKAKNLFGKNMCYSNDNTKLFSINRISAYDCISIYDIVADSTVGLCKIPDANGYYNYDGFTSFDVSPNDKYIAVQTEDGTVACFRNPVDSLTSAVKMTLANATGLKLHPNPTTDFLNFTFSVRQNEYEKIILTDPMRSVERTIIDGHYESGEYSERINLQGLSAGLYYLVRLTDKSSEMVKFLIVR